MKMKLFTATAFTVAMGISSIVSAQKTGAHPAYGRAIGDLRNARSLLENGTADMQQTIDELNALKEINSALGELKQAAFVDEKDVTGVLPTDKVKDRITRVNKALEYLVEAHTDISQKETDTAILAVRRRASINVDRAAELLRICMKSQKKSKV